MPPKRKATLEVADLRVLLPEGAARDNGAVLMKGAGKYDFTRGEFLWHKRWRGRRSPDGDRWQNTAKNQRARQVQGREQRAG